MLSTWKIFPKGLFLYSNNFLLSDERRLSLGLILKDFHIFHNYFHPHGKDHCGEKSMLPFRWFTCWSYISGFCDFYLQALIVATHH